MPSWHQMSVEDVLRELGSTLDGLTDAQADQRAATHGPNRLQDLPGRSPWAVLASQFTEIMVVVLVVAAALSLAIGELTDSVMILLIIVLNAALGFSQEYRAERAMAALKRLAVPTVRVRRDGQTLEIPTEGLVPGDIVLLEAGARVPADGRLVQSASVRVDEAALTGESAPVDKAVEAIPTVDLPLGERHNMVYMGTAMTYGRGTAVLTETGMHTELGHIADMLQTVREERTPLQHRMAELGKWLALGALVICAVVFALGLWRGGALTDMLLTAVSLAVAAVPEGLPAVVTIALALGAQRMVRRHALIRRLPAVETLGSVTTICSDKTGTLTENRMTVMILDSVSNTMDLVASLRTAGPYIAPGEAPLGEPLPNVGLLLVAGALCNDATLERDLDGKGGYHAVGDPTEGALVVVAARLGLWKSALERRLPRVAEAPFTSERKRMTTVHSAQECLGKGADCLPEAFPQAPWIAFTKGSVDGLLTVSTRVWDEGRVLPLDEEWRRRIEESNSHLAREGMRVLGVAMRPLEALPQPGQEEGLEDDLVFLGLAGMIDPPRPEVREAVARCRDAGIRPVMITGDHPLTALNIARELGIVTPESQAGAAINGQRLAELSVDELEGIVESVSVYARVSPEHKVKIVEALQRKGHFVAMTGDGVNDAPALKRADIGVAMGITGTDVSKEASDMVLLDDNFATIVSAIEEGRTIYSNIRKFVGYIISSNVGEIALMLLAPLMGLPMPLTAVQLLWVNLVTDGLPGLALGMEPTDPDTMRRPPNPPRESVLARGLGVYVLGVGALLGALCLGVQYANREQPTEVWQTMVFMTLTLGQMGNALAMRSERQSLFKLGLFSNKPLLGAVGLTVLLQMLVTYLRPLQRMFGTTALDVPRLVVCVLLSAVVFGVVEGAKWVARRSAVA